MNQLTNSNSLRSGSDPAGYDRDFVLWIAQQLELLRAKKFELLDLDNVIEEFDSMGKNQRHELRSRLETLLVHLLKCEFQSEKKSGSWLATVHEQRSQIRDLIKTSPSLKNWVQPFAEQSYQAAIRRAAAETGMPPAAFPSSNPYSVQALLDPDFAP